MNIKLLIGIIVLAASQFVVAAPAFAEFESKNGGSSQGKGEVFEVAFEASGAKVLCQAFEPSNLGKVEWTVEKEGKPSTKGPDLQIKVNSWGACEAAKPINGSVKISKCEFEIEQPGEQEGLSGKVVKGCTIEAKEGCVIKLEAKNNTQLKAFEVGEEGNAAENTVIGPEVGNLTTEVKSCTGIEATKQGKMTGLGELYLVHTSAGGSTFKKEGMGVFNNGNTANGEGTSFFNFREPGAATETKFQCTEAKYTGTIAANAPIINVTPTYGMCKEATNNITATVSVTDCSYQYQSGFGFDGGALGPHWVGRSQLVGNGCAIDLTATAAGESCEIVIAAQAHALGSGTYANSSPTVMKVQSVLQVPFDVKDPTKCSGFTAIGEYEPGFIIGTYKINEINVG
jgi:hypothetical protein